MANYKISEKAKSDIIEIWEYTFQNWSLLQADKYYDSILDQIEVLAQSPKIGKNYADVRKDYFGSTVNSHIIFYKLLAHSEIEIIRILHQRMDLKNKLS